MELTYTSYKAIGGDNKEKKFSVSEELINRGFEECCNVLVSAIFKFDSILSFYNENDMSEGFIAHVSLFISNLFRSSNIFQDKGFQDINNIIGIKFYNSLPKPKSVYDIYIGDTAYGELLDLEFTE